MITNEKRCESNLIAGLIWFVIAIFCHCEKNRFNKLILSSHFINRRTNFFFTFNIIYLRFIYFFIEITISALFIEIYWYVCDIYACLLDGSTTRRRKSGVLTREHSEMSLRGITIVFAVCKLTRGIFALIEIIRLTRDRERTRSCLLPNRDRSIAASVRIRIDRRKLDELLQNV